MSVRKKDGGIVEIVWNHMEYDPAARQLKNKDLLLTSPHPALIIYHEKS